MQLPPKKKTNQPTKKKHKQKNTTKLHTKLKWNINGLSVAVKTPPDSVPPSHLLGEAQPHPNQVGVIHNVAVRQGGSFGAPRRPLQDTRHYGMMTPFPRMSFLCSPERFPWVDLALLRHKKMVQVQLNRIHMEPSHLHQPLRKGWVARTAEARGEARTFPPSYRRRQKHGLVSEGRRQRKWDVQLPMSPAMNPTTRHGAGRSTYWSKLDVDGLVTREALLRGSQLLHVAAVPGLHHLIHVEGARQLGVQRDDNG